MAEGMRRVNVLLQSLARLPGLGFLTQAEYRLRDALDVVDDAGDQLEDNQRHFNDVKNAVTDLATGDEELGGGPKRSHAKDEEAGEDEE